MEHAIGESFFSGGSEAQLLNLAARRFQSLGPLIEAWDQSGLPPDEVYPYVWRRHGFVPRVIADRQRALRELARVTAPDTYETYVAARRDLARVLLVSMTDNDDHNAARLAGMRKLNTIKDELEHQLTRDLEPQRIDGHAARDVRTLVEILPERSAFVDFLSFSRRPFDATVPSLADGGTIDQLVAFVVTRGHPIAFVDLGDPAEIAALVAAWKEELAADVDGGAGATLRKKIWDPVSRHLPAEADTIYVAPDGVVAEIAWTALPCPDNAGVLLERYAFATVPCGRSLVDRLQESNPAGVAPVPALAVGDVEYGQANRDAAAPMHGLEQWRWPRLSGSRRELEAIESLANGRALTVLSGADATIDNVLRALSATGTRSGHPWLLSR